MSSWIDSSYPPSLSSRQEEYLLDHLKSWSISNGLAVRPASAFVLEEQDPSASLAVTAPVTLFPSPFPRRCFEQARRIQTAYNELYAAISSDEDWLKKIVEELVGIDDFVASLWNVHLTVKKEGYVQPLTLGLFRSDYMVHSPTAESGIAESPSIKQVEFNTISASFGGLSTQVSRLHRYLHSLPASPYPLASMPAEAMPPNNTATDLSAGVLTAHRAYGPSKSTPSLPLCVLVIVQPTEHNIFDQYQVTHLVHAQHVPIFRLEFPSIFSHTSIPSENPLRPLLYTPPHSPDTTYEVTVVYYRSGYAPDDYLSGESWKARIHLERSAAIKCPSILTQLSGIKKVQQVLATPSKSRSYLKFFLPHAPDETIDSLLETFCAQYPLASPGSENAREDVADAIKGYQLATDPSSSEHFVLKPNREGGGNNTYGSNIPPFIASLAPEKLPGYVLMQLIEPPQEGRGVRNYVFRNGQVSKGEVIGELGVFGTCVWNQHAEDKKAAIQSNEEAGYLLRTKGRESQEGGVAAGFGCVDSCLLV